MFSNLVEEIRFFLESSQQSPLITKAVSPAAKQGGETLKSRGKALSHSWAEAERETKNTKVRQAVVGDDYGGKPVGSVLPPDSKTTEKSKKAYMGAKPLSAKVASNLKNVAALQNVAKALVRKKRIDAAKKAAAAKKKASLKASKQGSLQFSAK